MTLVDWAWTAVALAVCGVVILVAFVLDVERREED